MSIEKNHLSFDLSSVQRFIFNLSLFVLPWFFIPLPWDITERSKSLIFLSLSLIIILLEVINWIWKGRVLVFKSKLDLPILLLLLSVILSTLLAKDIWVSVWGIDGRLSGGLIVLCTFIGDFLFFRNFIADKRYLLNSIEAFVGGITITILLSILSFFRVDIFGTVGWYKSVFNVGLPLTFSFGSMFVLAFVALVLSMLLLFVALEDKKYSKALYIAALLLINSAGIILSSIPQSPVLIVLLLLTIAFISTLVFIKFGNKQRYVSITISIVGVLVCLSSFLMQGKAIRKTVLGEEFNIVSPVQLGSELSWNVATSTLSSGVSRGLFGLGNDSFAIAYSYFKPATQDVISLGNISFNSGYNEVFTIMSNRGLLGLLIWLFVGYVLVKVVLNNIKEFDKESELIYILPSTLALFVYLSSFLLSYSFLLYLTLFILLLFTAVIPVFVKRGSVNMFTMKFWAIDSSNTGKKVVSVNWVATVMCGFIASFLFIRTLSLTVSTAFLLKAEAYSYEENKKYSSIDPTLEQREEYLKNMVGYYDRALLYDEENPVINRRLGLFSLKMLSVVSEKYSEDITDDEKEQILNSVPYWKNMAIDFTREAINTSLFTYANWNARASVYVDLVGFGLQDYSSDAIATLDTSLNLNPLDYEAYYQKSKVYLLTKDYERAIASVNKGLNINSQHLPSLILGAQIYKEKGDMGSYATYLMNAKNVLEITSQQESQMYNDIVKSIDEAKAGSTEDTTDTTEEVKNEETTNTGSSEE